MHDTLDYIIQNTNNITLIWKQAAAMSLLPNSVSKKIDSAMLDWLRDLTKTLRLWTDKGFSMTSGELILARVNLGSVVESWLKFFYCVHNVDYHKSPLINKRGVIEPNNLSFDELKRYSEERLYDKNGNWVKWVDSIQKKRNSIHAFNSR